MRLTLRVGGSLFSLVLLAVELICYRNALCVVHHGISGSFCGGGLASVPGSHPAFHRFSYCKRRKAG